MHKNSKSHTNSLPPPAHRRGFTPIGPKDHDRNEVSGRERTNRAAFTLIELIVVMAVIGILVLLATPKFLNYTGRAREAQIKNDIKVLETKIDEYLINHDKFPDEWDKAVSGGGQLYDRTGPIDSLPEGDFKVVDKTFYPETNLGGDFYADANGEVIYEDNGAGNTSGEGPIFTEVPEYAKDKPIPEGDGTEENPYEIWYLEHLDWIDTDESTMSANYKVMRDLDFQEDRHYLDISNKSSWTTGDGWSPIHYNGEPNIEGFSGSLDGQNNKLYSLFIDRRESYSGLFRQLYAANITNYSLLSVNIAGKDYVGAISGYSEGLTAENIEVSGELVATESYTGGLFGMISGGYDDSDIFLTDLRNHVSVTGNDEVGGVVGIITASATLENVENFARISGNESVGGILGMGANDYLDMTNGINYGKIEGDVGVGGISGAINSGGEFKNLLSEGDIVGNEAVGGIFGKLNTSSYIGTASNSGAVDGGDYVGGIIGQNNTGGTFKELTSSGKISGDDYVGGLLGISNSSTILLSPSNSGSISGNDFVGGIVGENNSSLTGIGEILNTGKIVGHNHIGGVVGHSTSNLGSSKITNTGDIEATGDYVGGIVGESNGRISPEEIAHTGKITGNNYVGGTIGSSSQHLSSRIITINGEIEATGNYVGGIIGGNYYYIVSDEISHVGKITGNDYVGGLVGENNQAIEANSISHIGDINAKNIVGGLYGFTWVPLDYKNIYIEGDILGETLVGGIVGQYVAEGVFIIEQATLDISVNAITGPTIYFGFKDTETIVKINGVEY